MEFPPEAWEVFDSANFETAASRTAGDVSMELMVQARPNGRCLDHFRIATGGSALLTARLPLTSVMRSPVMARFHLRYQFWGRDIRIRRNMTSGIWMDVTDAIEQNVMQMFEEGKDEAVTQESFRTLLSAIEDPNMRSASFRHAVVASADKRMQLEIQLLPASAATLNGKPTFLG